MSVYVGERDVVAVTGVDATTYLQGQISQDVLALAPGTSAWSLALQPQGKVDAWFRITKQADDAYLLDVDAGYGEALLARLQRFLLRTKAELSLETWVLHAYDAPLDEPHVTDAPIVAVSADGQGTDVVGPSLPPSTEEVVASTVFEQRRIRAGIPAMGAELDESTIPAEARIVDRSVSFTKGCYTGQELVARVDSRGDNTPRRLRVIDGPGAASVGDELFGGDAVAGTITSVAETGDGFVALAYVKRSSFDASELLLDDRSVSVQPVPGDDS